MRVLFDINHPGHVHLFKHCAWELEGRGHACLMVARDKDVTLALLEGYRLPYARGTRRGEGLWGLFAELVRKTARIIDVAREFRPGLILSHGSPAAAWAAWRLGVPHIAFYDTEHSWEQYLLFAPFTSLICTSSAFRRGLGRKQLRYEGYHELAYLHPRRFTPDPAIRGELGLAQGEEFFLVRFVSWQASHDVGARGFSEAGKRRLIEGLSRYGRVFITSEAQMPEAFAPFRVPVAPARLHDLLAFAALYVGEGATMASEAAMLGVPSIYVNTLSAGTLEEQERRYGLLHRVPAEDCAIELALELACSPQRRSLYRERRERMLREKIDLTEWMVKLVEDAGRQGRRCRSSR